MCDNAFYVTQPHEPPEQQVILHLFNQLPRRAAGTPAARDPDRGQDLDQPLRRDGEAAKVGIELIKRVIETGERVIEHLPDLAQLVFSKDALLNIDIAE